MRVLDSPYIIKLYENIEEIENSYYVMEIGKGKDLHTLITERGRPLSEVVAAQIMAALFEAIDYMHRAGIVHRDLKPENLMVDIGEDKMLKSLKIIDFGLATYIQDIKKQAHPVGTLNFMAPECFVCKYDERIDVFALGVILYYMLSSSLPFHDFSPEKIIQKTKECTISLDDNPLFADASAEVKDILQGLLAKDPANRISIENALVHKWITLNGRPSFKSLHSL